MRFLLALLLTSCAVLSAQGWTAQEQVSRPDTAGSNIQPTLFVDHEDTPWAVWHSLGRDRNLVYSRRTAGVWTVESLVSPHPPEVRDQLRPALARGADGQPWLVWANAKVGNDGDLASSRWTGRSWTPENRIHPPDSTDLNFAPRLAAGGCRAWCVWYGGPTDVSPYSVYASEWDSVHHEWMPETQVSPADGCHHWWCDVAVDTTGTPHVAWIQVPDYLALYSRWDGLH